MDIRLLDIFSRFDAEGKVDEIVLYGNGHIHKTYLVKTNVRNYMLQQVNSYVFPDIDGLMRNIRIVTRHLRGKGKDTLCVHETFDRKPCVHDGDAYYRLYTFIENTKCYDRLDSSAQIEKSGMAFGEFHAALADLDPASITETIPNFHDTPKRYQTLLASIRRDAADRLSDCTEILDFIGAHKDGFSRITEALSSGELPRRIVHNDPKTNNILFDENGNDVKCIIDLDTVMPGSCLFDYGDALRSLFTADAESAREGSLPAYDSETFKAYTRGYLRSMKSSLTPLELELMPASVFTITMEQIIRFLTDYLDGDKYFRISFPDENLVRARNQLYLAKDILNHMDEMVSIIRECV